MMSTFNVEFCILFIVFLTTTKILADVQNENTCPTETRPHPVYKYVYYKCRQMPFGQNVWIMIQCPDNLQYEEEWGKCMPFTPLSASSITSLEEPGINANSATKQIHIESSNDSEISPEMENVEESDNLEREEFSRIDPKFVAQLQRLSQLMDGLRQTAPTNIDGHRQSELRPHELNAFLAHFNIKNQFNSLSSDQSAGSAQIQSVGADVVSVDPLRRRDQLKMTNSNQRNKYIINNILSDHFIQTLSPPVVPLESTSELNAAAHDVSEEHHSTILELTQQLINSEHVPTIISKPNLFHNNRPSIEETPMENNNSPSINDNHLISSSHYSTQMEKGPTLITHNNVMPLKVIEHGLGSGNKDSMLVTSQTWNHVRPPISTTQMGLGLVGGLNKSNLLQDYFIPTQHLNDANANHIFENSNQPPFNPVQMMSHQLSDKGQKPLPWVPTIIDRQRVQIQPNAQSGLSSETGIKYEQVALDLPSTSPSSLSSTATQPLPKPTKPNVQIIYDPLAISPSSTTQTLLPTTTTTSSPLNGEGLLEVLKPTFLSANGSSHSSHHHQLLNIDGNYINAEVFFKAMVALLAPNAASQHTVQLITCMPGVRQPNATDCTRYFVCAKHSARVLSYSCPPYTAFNSFARICDADTYSSCKIRQNDSDNPKNSRRKPSPSNYYSPSTQKKTKIKPMSEFMSTSSSPPPVISSSTIRRPSTGNRPKKGSRRTTTTTARPSTSTSSTTTLRAMVTIKRYKYYCKEGEKVADRTSSYKYYVCYKNARGQMKGQHMTCSKGLLFCARTSMCTSPNKCR